MAEKCRVPKSSLEGYMRLKGAKRPGTDALIAIADAMDVSIDWLVGRSDGQQLGEADRKQIVLSMYRLLVELLQDIDEAQSQVAEPVVQNGMVGNREIEDFAVRLMLHFLTKENLFPNSDFDSFRIFDELLQK